MSNSRSIKERREACGLSQATLAERVAQLANGKFSQQSLANLEKTPQAKSRYMHFVLRALDEAEGRTTAEAAAQPAEAVSDEDAYLKAMLVEWRRADPERQRAALGVLLTGHMPEERQQRGRVIQRQYDDLFDDFTAVDEVIEAGTSISRDLPLASDLGVMRRRLEAFIPEAVEVLQKFRSRMEAAPALGDLRKKQ